MCEAHQRGGMERLCHNITRPPIAAKHLSLDGRDRIGYQYRQPFGDGSTHVVPVLQFPCFWPNWERNSPAICILGSSVMRLIAEILCQQVGMAANDPFRKICCCGQLINWNS